MPDLEAAKVNYLTGPELRLIADFIQFLNDHKPPVAPLSVEVKLIDSNGEDAGEIAYGPSGGAYLYVPPTEDLTRA